jgi:hypothetical protein
LKLKIEAKKKVLSEKHQRLHEIRGNLARIDKYGGEKNCEGKYY